MAMILFVNRMNIFSSDNCRQNCEAEVYKLVKECKCLRNIFAVKWLRPLPSEFLFRDFSQNFLEEKTFENFSEIP